MTIAMATRLIRFWPSAVPHIHDPSKPSWGQVAVPAVRKLTPREQKLQELREKIRLARHKNKEVK